LKQVISVAVAFSLSLAPTSPLLARANDEGTVGSLSVASDPAGAAVYVDGTFAGQTPLSLDRLAAGDHRVRVVKSGYLENGRVVNVSAGSARSVDVKLTKFEGAATMAAAPAAAAGGEGSFFTSPLFLIAAAGGGAAAFFLLKNTNKPPTVAGITVTPASGLAGTTFTFAPLSPKDPEGDALTYSWNFGDNATGTGASATHAYAAAGTFTVTLTTSDGKNKVTTTTTVTVKSLTGTWKLTLTGGSYTGIFTLTQTGASITGTFNDGTVPGTVTGSISGNNVTIVDKQTGFVDMTLVGTLSGADSITGTATTGFNGQPAFTLTRQ
jgi:PKD repeat protein